MKKNSFVSSPVSRPSRGERPFGKLALCAAAVALAGVGSLRADTVLANNSATVTDQAGVNGLGQVTINAGGVLNYTGAGDVTMAANMPTGGTGTINIANANAVFTITGNFSGNNGLIKTGAGTFVIAGTGDNNSASVNVTEGVVIFAKASNGSVHSVGGGNTAINGGTLRLAGTGGDQIYNSLGVTLNTGTFDVNGMTEAFNTFTVNGGTVTNGTAATRGTLNATLNKATATALTLNGDLYISTLNIAGGSILVNGGGGLELGTTTINASTTITIDPATTKRVKLGNIIVNNSSTLNLLGSDVQITDGVLYPGTHSFTTTRTLGANDGVTRLSGVTLDGLYASIFSYAGENYIVPWQGYADIPVFGGVIPNNSIAIVRIIEGGTTGKITLAADTVTVESISSSTAINEAVVVTTGKRINLVSGEINLTAGSKSLLIGEAAGTNAGAFAVSGALKASNFSTDGDLIFNTSVTATSLAFGSPGKIIFNGTVTNTGTLVSNGPGTTVFNGTYVGSGVVTLTGGVVEVSNFANIGTGQINFNGGGLRYTGGTATATRALNIAAVGSTLDIADPNANLSIQGYFDNDARMLTKTGPGTLTLTGGGSASMGNAGTTAIIVAQGLVVIKGSVGSSMYPSKGVKDYALAVSGTGRVLIDGNDPLYFESGVKADGNGLIDFNGHSLGFAYLDGSGGVVTNSSATAVRLQLGGAFYNGSRAQNRPSDFGGRITGNIGIIKLGVNVTSTFFGPDNDYTGTTEVREGTLQIGTNDLVGSLRNSPITLSTNTTLAVFQANGTVGSSISGDGNIVKSSAGNVTLSKLTTTGSITVNAGNLAFVDDASAARLTLARGSFVDLDINTLTLNGSSGDPSYAGRLTSTTPTGADITGNLTLKNGHVLRIGAVNAVETLRVAGALALEGGTLQLTFQSAANHDVLVVDGTFSASDRNIIAFDSSTNIWSVPGVGYTLIELTGGAVFTDSQLNTFSLGGVTNTEDQAADIYLSTDKTKILLDVISVNNRVVWNGAGASDVWNMSATNWKNGAASVAFQGYDAVTFDGTATTAKEVRIESPVNAFSVAVTGSQNYTFVNGTGGKISGTASLIKDGSGTLTLLGDGTGLLNDFTHSVIIRQGVIELAGSGPLLANEAQPSLLGAGRGASALMLNGGTLRFNGTDPTDTNRIFTLGALGGTLEVKSTVEGSRVFFNDGTGRVFVDGDGARTLTLSGEGGANGITGDLTPTAAGGILGVQLLDGAGTGATLAVLKTGTGLWHLAGASSFTGGVTVEQGALSIDNSASLGRGTLTLLNGAALVNGARPDASGTLLTGGSDITLNSFVRVALGNGGGTLRIFDNSTLRINGIINGTGTLFKDDGGSLVLGGNNSGFEGGIHIKEGSVTAFGMYSLGTGVTTLESGTHLYLSNAGAEGGGLAGTAGTVENTFAGENATLVLRTKTGVDASFSGEIKDGNSYALNLLKVGPGTQELAGLGHYSGTTTVSEGVLRIGAVGAFGTGGIFVNAGGTLDIAGLGIGAVRQITVTGEGSNGKGALTDSSTGTTGVFPSFTLTTNAITVDNGDETTTTTIYKDTIVTTAGTTAFADVTGTDDDYVLILASYPGAGSPPVFVVNNGSTIDVPVIKVAAGTLQINSSERIANTTTLDLSGGAAVSVATNIVQTVHGLTGTGSITGTGTIVVSGITGTNAIFQGTIDGAANFTLSSGTLTLDNPASTTTGTITVREGGILRVDGDVLGDQTATLALENGTVNFISADPTNSARSLLFAGAGGAIRVDNGAGAVHITGTTSFGSSGSDYQLELTGSGTAGNVFESALANPSPDASGIPVRGSLLKSGSGIWTLGAGSSYLGGTTISAGTLRLGGNDAIPADTSVALGIFGVSGGGTLDLNGYNQQLSRLVAGNNNTNSVINASATASVLTLNVSASASAQSYSGRLGGGASNNNFSFVKAGTGELTLSGTLTYTGDTTVRGGTLILSGANATPTSAHIAVSPGARLDVSQLNGGLGYTLGIGQDLLAGSSATSGNVDLAGDFTLAGGILLVGNATSLNGSNVLTVDGAVTTAASSPASTLRYVLTSYPGGTNSTVKTAALNLNAEANILLQLTDGWMMPGIYSLFESQTPVTGDLENLLTVFNDPSDSDPRYTYAIETASGGRRVNLHVISQASEAPINWVGGIISGGTALWDGTVENFVFGNDPSSYSTGDMAFFGDDAQSYNVAVAPAGVIIGKITFANDAHDYVVGGGDIGGEGYLEKRGSGTLTLSGANTYRGEVQPDGTRAAATVLAAGTLALGHNNALGEDALRITGGILRPLGTRALANTVVLSLGTNAVIESRTAADSLALNGILRGDISTVLTKTGIGAVSVNGNATEFAGTLVVADGTLNLAASTLTSAQVNLSGTNAVLSLNGTGAVTTKIGALTGGVTSRVASSAFGVKTLEVGARGTDAVFDGGFFDTAASIALTKVGSGTQVLRGDNSGLSGLLSVEAGTLQLGDGVHGTASTGTLSVAGTGNARLVLFLPQDFSLTQSLLNEGVFEKRGTNTLEVSVSQSGLNGTVLISEGVLRLTGSGTLGGAIVANNARLQLELADGYIFSNDLTGTGTLVKDSAGTVTYLGNNIGTGTTTVKTGTLRFGDGYTVAQQRHSAAVELLGGTALQLVPAAGGTVSAGSLSGIGAVEKSGDGTAYLTGLVQVHNAAPNAADILVRSGALSIGDGTGRSVLDVVSTINVQTGATLAVSRTGDTRLSAPVEVANGTVNVSGDNNGTGKAVFASAENQITGTLNITRSAIAQVGDTAAAGRLNDDTDSLVVTFDPRAILRFTQVALNAQGEGETGSELLLRSKQQGAGTVEYAGTGTLRFTSQTAGIGTDAFSGTFQAGSGTFALELGVVPSNSILNATGTGKLRLEADAPAVNLGNAFGSGDGTVILDVKNDPALTGVRYEFANAPVFGGTFAVADKATLHLKETAADSGNISLTARELELRSGALLTGNGTVQGSLRNLAGGVIEPGNAGAAGQINIAGNFANDGLLLINMDDTAAHSTIHYTGSAVLGFDTSSVRLVISESTLARLAGIAGEVTILVDDDTHDGRPSVVGGIRPDNITLVITDDVGQVLEERTNEVLSYGKSEGFALLFAQSINQIPNFKLHDSLRDYERYITEVLHSGTALATTVNGFLGQDNGRAASGASPVGLASMTAMTINTAHDAAGTLHSHLESLRYGRARLGRSVDTQPYFVGTGLVAENGGGRSDPAFDFNTVGGMVGADLNVGADLILGLNAGYSHGRASLAYGAGTAQQNNMRVHFYGTYMVNDFWYVDALAFAGHSSYEVKHTTLSGGVAGTAKAEPSGYDFGAGVFVGRVLPVNTRVEFTPYAGLEYVYGSVDAFTEKGSTAALYVAGFDQTSLRVKLGTGLNWNVPTKTDFSLRLGLNVAYAYELLDTEASLKSRFAADHSGNGFRVAAPSTSEHSLQIGPTAEFGLTDDTSLQVSYRYENDFANQSVHHFNATFRVRF